MSGKLNLHQHQAPELYEAAIDTVNVALEQNQRGQIATLPDADSRIHNLSGHVHREIHQYLAESDPRRLKAVLAYLMELSGVVLRAIVQVKEKLGR